MIAPWFLQLFGMALDRAPDFILRRQIMKRLRGSLERLGVQKGDAKMFSKILTRGGRSSEFLAFVLSVTLDMAAKHFGTEFPSEAWYAAIAFILGRAGVKIKNGEK